MTSTSEGIVEFYLAGEPGPVLAELLDDFERLGAENLATLAGWRRTDERLALEGYTRIPVR